MIDARLAESFWPSGEAVGRVIQELCNGCTRGLRVIGVVEPVRYRPLELDTRFSVYDLVAQRGDGGHGMYLVTKTGAKPESLIGTVRDAFAAVDLDQPVIDVQTMEARMADVLLPRRLASVVLQLFALLALLITAIGLYGSITYRVTQARHAIAVCIALGAGQYDVRVLVLRRAIALTLAGLVLGLVGAIGFSRLIEGMLYGVTATDVPTIALLAAVLAVVGGVAAWIPAHRATRIDPMLLLKST